MTWSVSLVVKTDGNPFSFTVETCHIALGGEFGGNIELEINCDPGRADFVGDHLSVALPHTRSSVAAGGWQRIERGVCLVFHISEVSFLEVIPERVQLLWEDEVVGEISTELRDTIPFEDSGLSLESPDTFLTKPPQMAIESHALLTSSREGFWYLLTALCAGVALVGAAASPAFGIEGGSPHQLGWGGLLFAFAALGVYLARTPNRRVLLDRDGRRVILVRGRRTSIQGGNSSPLEDFHHVRLYMRWSMSTDTQFDDQPVWTVALEPRVFWADRSGRILLHPKGLEVASGLDEQRARQVAGEVAYHTGLPILNTAHEHTA